MADEYAEWLKAGNHRLSSVGDQHQQHGVGRVEQAYRAYPIEAEEALHAWRDQQEQQGGWTSPAGWWYAAWMHQQAEVERLRVRCASLEAVVEAARGIALRQSPAHQALRQALAALDQHAITTQEGTHG